MSISFFLVNLRLRLNTIQNLSIVYICFFNSKCDIKSTSEQTIFVKGRVISKQGVHLIYLQTADQVEVEGPPAE